MSVIGTNVSPIPIEASMIPGRRSVTYEPSGCRRMKRSRPTTAIGIPMSGTSRAPSFGTRLCDSPAPMMIPGREREEREPGLERGVAEHALEVQRVEVEHREEPGGDEEHDDVRGAHRPHAEDAQTDERLGRARSIDDERAEQRDGEREESARVQRRPSPSPAP